MNDIYQHLLLVILPLLMTNIMHMLVVKSDVLQVLKQPISKKLFGKNKTWRGFVFVSFINGIVFSVITLVFQINIQNSFLIGFILGLAYVVFELPNSFIKRRLGIAPGKQASSNKIWFTLIDKTDSAFGVVFVYFLLGFIDYQYAVLLFLGCSAIHISFSLILLKLKLKTSF